jgi:predicted phosphoadenosine phosphosulfate sulfurtransferase
MNVYEAAINRLDFIFNNFENIYLSFSGGKDSGAMLNLTIDYMRKKGITKKITVLYIDLEAMYQSTVTFIENMVIPNQDIINIHWVCLPMLTTNGVSMYEPYWIFWEESKKDLWVRDMPNYPFIINTETNIFPFFRVNMTFEDFIIDYAKWQSSFGKTACMVGIRSDESLNRWRAVNRGDVARYENQNYSVLVCENCYNFYPIYDWSVEDIWTYNGKFNKEYNKIYDLMYKAGVPISKMRVCEPYGDEQKAGLHLFKVLEPATWYKVVSRVSGANFGSIYANTKATGARKITLPKGHTWKSYTKFLLKTLPKDTQDSYKKKFIKFINYWRKVGSPLGEDILKPIIDKDCVVTTTEYSTRGRKDKYVVKFNSIPDTITGDNKTDLLSWRRMCMAILKNDVICRSLCFSLTKDQLKIRSATMLKFKQATL